MIINEQVIAAVIVFVLSEMVLGAAVLLLSYWLPLKDKITAIIDEMEVDA